MGDEQLGGADGDPSLEIFRDGGETGALMRAIDWSSTPLGPVARWPQSLRTLVRVMLASRFAMRVIWGEQFIFLYNDAYRPVLGRTKHPSAMASRTSESFAEVWDTVGPMFRRVYAGEAVALEDTLLALDRNGYREECYFTLSYSPIHEDDGRRVGGVLGVVHETTERVLAERRLRTLRELAASVATAQTSEVACRTAIETLGRNPNDVPFALLYRVEPSGRRAVLASAIGLEHYAAVRPDALDLDAASAGAWPLREAFEARAPVTVADLPRRFGAIYAGPYPEPVHSALIVALTRPGLDRPYGFFIAGVNPRCALDERYRTFFELASEHVVTAIANAVSHEEERRRAEALAELDRAKTTFFNNVSHEFRTPLTLMLGPTEDALASPAETLSGESLKTVYRNELRLLKLVNSLLDFSRLEAGRADASFEAVDLAALTENLASGFRSLVESAGLTFDVRCEALPEPAYVDREMWERIVLNLLSNAYKFTFEGGITVTLARRGERVVLTVADTGTGIPDTEVPHLFERFHRVQGARSRSFEGSGIGLALVHELVRQHGGTLSVESEVGKGSAFAIGIPLGSAHLPAERVGAPRAKDAPSTGGATFLEEARRWSLEASPPAPLDAPATAPPPPVGDGARPRVLVVDDNADMREYLGRLLAERYVVETATDGRAALWAADARVPDLVISDVMMPELDGYGLLRALRGGARTARVPVILLSARAGDEARVEGFESGADDYLGKPFAARELLARVHTQLELARARGAAERARARLYSQLQQAPVAISIVAGPEHTFEFSNPRYERMVGRTALVGRPFLAAFPELDASAPVVAMLDRVRATGETFSADEYLVPLDRKGTGVVEDTWFLFTCEALRDEDGRIMGIITVAVDVTELVLARQRVEHLAVERERLIGALERTNAELDQFAYVASHDLKAPLRGIANLSQWIEDDLGPSVSDEGREYLRLMRGRIHRLEALIDGILSYSRAGRVLERPERVDVGRLVSEVVELLAPPAEATIEIQPGLPAVDAERTSLQQVFMNLIANALKHGRSDALRVGVGWIARDGGVEFVVTDNGPGIAPQFHERIWGIFQTLEARDKVEGTGIGLSIVKKIVESRGGRVWVESAEGRGAAFRFTWPCAARAADPAT